MKEKQQDIVLQIEEHTEADESYYITASTVLNLAKRALEIFESSQITEKRQLLNFLLQNCRLEGKKLMFTIRNPFGAIVTATENNSWLTLVREVRTNIMASKEYIYIPDLATQVAV